MQLPEEHFTVPPEVALSSFLYNSFNESHVISCSILIVLGIPSSIE